MNWADPKSSDELILNEPNGLCCYSSIEGQSSVPIVKNKLVIVDTNNHRLLKTNLDNGQVEVFNLQFNFDSVDSNQTVQPNSKRTQIKAKQALELPSSKTTECQITFDDELKLENISKHEISIICSG